MNLRTIVGRYELEDTQNGFTFTFNVPAQFTWESLHASIASMGIGAKEWESLVKKNLESVPGLDDVNSEIVVTEEATD